ncbi:hypothetical protein Tco_1379219 [Tanacetum coccineum]
MEGCSGVEAAAVAVAESGGEGVEARELTGRIDPEMRIILGVGRKNSPEDYSGGRRAAAMVGEGWPAVEYERGGREYYKKCVSGKTEKLSGISFYINLL